MIRRFPLLAGIALLSSAGAAVCPTAAHQPPQQQQAEASPDIAEPGIVFAERQPAIPFELFREQRIFFTGKVNGSATEMMLDSGANITVIDRKFADSLGIKADEQVSVQGVSAEAQGGIARGVDLDVGGLGIRDATVLILDMDAIARGVGRAVPVVLGHEAMDAGVVTIDFPARTIRFASRDGFAPPTLNLTHPDPECDLDCVPLVGRERPLEHALKLSIAFGGHLAAIALRRWTGQEARAAVPLSHRAAA